jgi:hypothetical protein
VGADMIFTITIDNASSNEVAIDYTRGINFTHQKRKRKKDCTVFEGELFHMLCNRWNKTSLRP